MVVEMGNGASLDYHDFYDLDSEISPQHYAFLVIRRNQVLPRRRVKCKSSPTIEADGSVVQGSSR